MQVRSICRTGVCLWLDPVPRKWNVTCSWMVPLLPLLVLNAFTRTSLHLDLYRSLDWLRGFEVAVSYAALCCSSRIYQAPGEPWRTYPSLQTSKYHYAFSSWTKLESTFLPLNPKVHASPTQLAWHPFDIPEASKSIDFIDGLKTLAGNGDPTLREGLAIHMYLANASMKNKAFCNNDGDFLILPQLGRLDIQTEFGKCVCEN